eukprot:TRINITY_DN9043_c0_g3_i4.p2 TRINITY_DN9043_c0_g3~~TRINITY_DN9043_c0_g3_i4.p2  ORF type:complete len:108 (-),score=31.99 TRINITY_DN9043_c0_g3_i4:53-346(-)
MGEAFYLATQGGATALGLGQLIGSFAPGKLFDAILIDPCSEHSPFDLFGAESRAEVFEKFVHLGDDRNMVRVWVQGQIVCQHTQAKVTYPEFDKYVS